jgi:succinylarginine dihydrolase
MTISTLTLALSVFSQNDLRVINVSKSDKTNYQLFYRKDGKNRVMMVPKECDNIQKLQSEVQTLISRNHEEQLRLGDKDGR